MCGWIKAHRQMRSSPMLSTAVRKGVWLDLLLMAAYQPTRTSLRGRSIELQPGECAVVIADWAKSLGLTSRQIERIVDSFVSENAVSKRSAAGKAFTIITICNYAKYQHEPLPRGESAVEGTGEARWKDGGSEQEVEESKESDSSASADAAMNGHSHQRAIRPADRFPAKSKLPTRGGSLAYPDEFEAAWAAYPIRPEDGKSGCYDHWRSWVVTKRTDPEVIIDGAKAYAKAKAGDEMRLGFRRWCREGLWMQQAPPDQHRARAPASPASYPGEW